MAGWDALARAQGAPLAALLGGTRPEILSGVSLGIEGRIEALFDPIDRYLEEGYRRIKLKIAPGWDVDVVRRVRHRHPSMALQVAVIYTPFLHQVFETEPLTPLDWLETVLISFTAFAFVEVLKVLRHRMRAQAP